ncbi:flagellar biosynthesis protein FliQ [Turicibacter sanguinis]|uniref:flagellar biosynthesis protein FliQ n=1 Tax=Turicibacter sanguinis TaxID=154288 RepID=UPI0018AB88E8|nr:flagellar biosynthesis protein FliQ [Turicibacter sanguinis]MDB8551133.1 flagellar biosynthesis protein FliQ [Turicibacter sanguinis]
MSENILLMIMQDAFMTLLKVAGPILIISLGVGLVISIIQAVTQIQEQTLTFVPKLLTIAITLLVMGPYFLNQLVGFFERIVEYIMLIV